MKTTSGVTQLVEVSGPSEAKARGCLPSRLSRVRIASPAISFIIEATRLQRNNESCNETY